MNQKKFIITVGACLLISLLITGYAAVAAEYGSKDDPLVTLSYVTEVLAPDTLKQMDAVVAEAAKNYTLEMEEKMKAYSEQLDKKLQDIGGSVSVTDTAFIDKVAEQVAKKGGDSASSWEVVKVAKGKTLKGEVGTELVLRIGTASCYASGSPGLINLSTGKSVEKGASLLKNQLYLATIADRGLTASDAVTVLVCGKYTIS